MPRRSSRAGFCVLLLASLVLHGGLLHGMSERAQAAVPKARPLARVSFKMSPVRPTEPAAEAKATAEVAPAAAPIARTKTRKVAQQAPAPKAVSRPTESTESASAPIDFAGVTLTNPSGSAGWASVTGNGATLQGALGAPARGTSTGSAAGSGSGGGDAQRELSAVVGLTSLSRPPRAPALDEALRTNYPAEARAQGLPGHALVRARILADGRVGDTRILLASAPEFGRACQRTLSGSRWSAPLDKRGQPVTTEVSYQCQFEVSR
jgi:TonB family protein